MPTDTVITSLSERRIQAAAYMATFFAAEVPLLQRRELAPTHIKQLLLPDHLTDLLRDL